MDETNNEQPEMQQEQQQAPSNDYSEPLFKKKPIDLLSVISAIIFIIAGITTLLTNAFGSESLLAGIILTILGVGVVGIQIYRSRGGAPVSSAIEWG